MNKNEILKYTILFLLALNLLGHCIHSIALAHIIQLQTETIKLITPEEPSQQMMELYEIEN